MLTTTFFLAFLALTQAPLQHFLLSHLVPLLLMHGLQLGIPPQPDWGRHDVCAAASGETIDSITGRRSEIPAARRRVRSISRREY